MPLNVAVIGCGYAGGALGLLLARAGHQVHVYEEVAEPGPVGAGILLQPSGMKVLSELGLVEQVLARGTLVQQLRGRTARGRELMLLRYDVLGDAFFGVGLHRGVLFEVLYEALLAEPLADVSCGLEIDKVSERSDGRLDLVGSDGQRYGPHDIVVMADGARSDVVVPRAPPRLVTPYPWGALWSVLEDPDEIFANELHQVVRGTSTMLGFLPTGIGPRSAGGGVPLVSMFWSVHMDRVDALRARGTAAFKDGVLELEPRAEPLLNQVDDIEQLIVASYRDVHMSRYHSRRVVYIGDAAHAMSPQLGQGANLALFDAWVLAQCLATERYPDRALAAYSRGRAKHLDYYQWANRFLTPFFQSDFHVLGWLRDAFMPLVGGVPPLRDQMIATMAGVQLGIFGKRIDVVSALPPISAVGAA